MAYSRQDLQQEIKDAVVADLNNGNTVVWKWLVHAVLKRHPLPVMSGDDREFNALCRYEAVSETVRDVLRQYKKEEEDPSSISGQGNLPGFTHLKLAYPVERDGVALIVPIQSMTSAEIRDRANQYYAMLVGCSNHADELIRYDDERTGSSPRATVA